MSLHLLDDLPPPLHLNLVLEFPRDDEQLIIRTHGRVGIPDDLQHGETADEFALLEFGGAFEGGVEEGVVFCERFGGCAGDPACEGVNCAGELPWWRGGADVIGWCGGGGRRRHCLLDEWNLAGWWIGDCWLFVERENLT